MTDIDDGLGDDEPEVKIDSRSTPKADTLLIYDGATVAQLAVIFERSTDTVKKLLRHITPTGRRKSADTYKLIDAAPYLVKPVIDEETFIKTITRTQDLPAYLQKEFWQAKLNRQKYEVQAGDLWPTDDVLSVFAEVFKKLATGISLFADVIEARTELTKEQRAILVELSDGLRTELRRVLIEGEYERVQSTEREKVISNAD